MRHRGSQIQAYAFHRCGLLEWKTQQIEDDLTHSHGTGPKGPRLPEGVKFIDLLPHLSAAKRVLAEKEIPFEQWVCENQWPGGMKVKSKTVRTWLTRYAGYIDEYDRLLKDK